MPSLEPIEDPAQLEAVVERVFSDPGARKGMGWTEADDPAEAIEAIEGLWQHRFEEGWVLEAVHADGVLAGLAGYGPVDAPEPLVAVYLLRRGEGIGTWATDQFIERAREQGARAVRAITWARNTGSRRMLEAIGFEAVGPVDARWARESELEWIEHRLRLEDGRRNP